MWLSLFVLPMLRFIHPQTGEDSYLQLLCRAFIVKDDGDKVKNFLNE